jgi:hypothetical protein
VGERERLQADRKTGRQATGKPAQTHTCREGGGGEREKGGGGGSSVRGVVIGPIHNEFGSRHWHPTKDERVGARGREDEDEEAEVVAEMEKRRGWKVLARRWQRGHSLCVRRKKYRICGVCA